MLVCTKNQCFFLSDPVTLAQPFCFFCFFQAIHINNYKMSPILDAKDKHRAKIPIILPNFLVRKFCGNAQFPHSFGQFAQTAPFQKISTPGN